MISEPSNGNGHKTGANREKVGPGRPPREHRFKPGNPGGGRPPGTSLTAIIKRVLAEPEGNGTKADKLIAMAEKRARKGDFRFFKELIDRNDGKVPDQAVSTGKLVIEVSYVNRPRTNEHADN